jgi:hypothetical protein
MMNIKLCPVKTKPDALRATERDDLEGAKDKGGYPRGGIMM